MPLRLVTPTFATLISVGGGGHTIEDEGSALTQRTSLNFVGANISCADSGGKTVCTITGATTTLNNLGTTSINATLIPQSGLDIGTSSAPWTNGYFGTAGSPLIRLQTASGFATVTATSGRILLNPSWYSGNGATNILSNDAYLMFEDGGNQHIFRYSTAQTPDTLQIMLGTTSRTLLIGERGDEAFDFAVPQQTQPTIVFASATQGTQTRGGLRHNDTQVELTDMATTAANARPVRLMGGSTVASAATITPTGTVFHVSGSTNIDTITIMGAGTYITLIFDGVLTVGDSTGNIKLPANFVTTADDTLTLASDGSSWFYVSQGVN